MDPTLLVEYNLGSENVLGAVNQQESKVAINRGALRSSETTREESVE